MFFTMKKLLFLLALLMAMATAGAQNASNEKCFFDKIVINLGVSAGTGYNNMHPLTLNADIGTGLFRVCMPSFMARAFTAIVMPTD